MGMEDTYKKVCPDCGHEMHPINLLTNPPIPGYNCSYCGKMLFGLENKTPGELLKEKESDIVNSLGKVSPSIPKDNLTVADSNDSLITQLGSQPNKSTISEIKTQPTSSIYEGLLNDMDILKNEHKWAMGQLKEEITIRQAYEKRLKWIVALSYFAGAIVSAIVVSMTGA